MVPILAFSLMAFASPAQDAAWMNLGHIEKDDYLFLLRYGICIQGKIQSIDLDSVTMVAASWRRGEKLGRVTTARSDVVQVLEAGIIYSNRSSWSDVQAVPAQKQQRLIVSLTSGKTLAGQPVDVGVAVLSLKQLSGVKKIPKAEIAGIEWVRPAPAEALAWAAQEGGIMVVFYPPFWPRVVGIGASMRVPLYDVSQPEDNSPAACPAPPLP